MTTLHANSLAASLKQGIADAPATDPTVDAILQVADEIRNLTKLLERTFGPGSPIKLFEECERCGGQGEFAPGATCPACKGSRKQEVA